MHRSAAAARLRPAARPKRPGRTPHTCVVLLLRRRAVWIPQAHKHKLSLLKGRDESLRSAQNYLYQGREYLQRRCSAALGREYPQLAGTVDQPVAAARLSQTHAAPQLALGAPSGLGGLLCLVGDAVIASGDVEKIEKNATAVRHAEGQAQCRLNVVHMLGDKVEVHMHGRGGEEPVDVQLCCTTTGDKQHKRGDPVPQLQQEQARTRPQQTTDLGPNPRNPTRRQLTH